MNSGTILRGVAFVLFAAPLAGCTILDRRTEVALQATFEPTPSLTAVPALPTVIETAPSPATSTATIEPSSTPGSTPTPDPVATLLAGDPPRVQVENESPDGRYRAETLIYGCATGEPGDAYEVLRVVDLETGQERQIAEQYHLCQGLGAFGLEPLFWSRSGRHLYYTDSREGGPDGGCRSWARPIAHADLADGSQAVMNQAATSPDGASVAGWLDGELIVYGPDGEELGRVGPPPGPPLVGPPAWSPDGRKLAYVQYTTYCGETGEGESAVVLVDASTLESRVLITQSAPEFDAVTWADAGRLELTGLMGGGRWVYDLASGELSAVP